MSTAPNIKILNLDDLETPESDISIVHEGKSHSMRVLTVERFIAQQRRAAEHEKLAKAKIENGEDVEDKDVADIVTLIRDSIVEFFPTLPVDDMATNKMFLIFAWLNTMSAEINESAGADVVESAEGNVEAPKDS